MTELIPTAAEMQRSLLGAWLLLLGRRYGLAAFDVSFDGFWRSFGVIVLLLPLNIVMGLAQWRIEEIESPLPPSLASLAGSQIVITVLDLVAFPFCLALAGKVLGVTRTYVPYVVARNWAAPIALTISLIPALLYAIGWIGQPVAAFGFLVAIAILLRYHYVILRAALAVAPGLAVALVTLDLTLSLVITQGISAVAGV